MYLRYSSSVVAPIVCSSPRASIGLSRFEASIAPSAAPAPDDRVELVDEQDDLALGVLDVLEDGLEPLLELAPELGAGDERAEVERDDPLVLERLGDVAPDDALGEALGDGRLADPGSPMRTGLFLVRRRRTWMTRRISSSRPMTGSSLPARASAVRSRPYFSSAWYVLSGFCEVTRWPPRTLLQRAEDLPRGRRRASRGGAGASPPASATPRSRCSVDTYSSARRRACVLGDAR